MKVSLEEYAESLIDGLLGFLLKPWYWALLLGVWAGLICSSCGSGKQLAIQEPEAPRHEAAAEGSVAGLAPPQAASPGLPLYKAQLASVGSRPVLPANASRQQYKAFKRELAAWESVQREQAKALRGPLFIGKGAVNAPAATGSIQNSYKPTDSGQATDSATVINSGGGAVAAGANASAQGGATRPDALSPLAVIAAKLTGPLGWVLAAAVVAALVWVGWQVWPLLGRRKDSTETTT